MCGVRAGNCSQDNAKIIPFGNPIFQAENVNPDFSSAPEIEVVALSNPVAAKLEKGLSERIDSGFAREWPFLFLLCSGKWEKIIKISRLAPIQIGERVF